jgi:hypothetical protein
VTGIFVFSGFSFQGGLKQLLFKKNKICLEVFAMKILKSADDRSDNRKMIMECKIFIALVRSL